MAALVVLLMAAIAAYAVPPPIRAKGTPELAAFAGLWVVGTALGVLQVLQVPLPNLTQAIVVAMNRIAELTCNFVPWL